MNVLCKQNLKTIFRKIQDAFSHHKVEIATTRRFTNKEDLVQFLDNMSSTYANNERYERIVIINFKLEGMWQSSSSNYIVEGYKADNDYEYQTATTYASNYAKYYRSKRSGTWFEWKPVVPDNIIHSTLLEAGEFQITDSASLTIADVAIGVKNYVESKFGGVGCVSKVIIGSVLAGTRYGYIIPTTNTSGNTVNYMKILIYSYTNSGGWDCTYINHNMTIKQIQVV